jgi:hypothetical protein
LFVCLVLKIWETSWFFFTELLEKKNKQRNNSNQNVTKKEEDDDGGNKVTADCHPGDVLERSWCGGVGILSQIIQTAFDLFLGGGGKSQDIKRAGKVSHFLTTLIILFFLLSLW